ncbi:hypothetical protein GPECTOR_194g324 [Gonium pectorale]|uniref:Patatin n=1 Tax=Gonium pectorale TaxID=33097 RepID=A0A150FX28_GONPE|nr:hypothetical protein GPECTOR_194g324 [Gonium pectorale]|eukprot:KXZ42156.1 hypothetical protein GPECTOR_194g324 [Gonium pectorale]
MSGCFGGRLSRSLSTPARSASAGALDNGFHSASGAAEATRHPALDALQSGRLAISFSGGGFLLPYFIGVAEVLQQLGVLRPGGATPVAGSSAGSLIASSLACGLTPDEMYDSFVDSVRDCRANGSYRRLLDVVSRQLRDTLPSDAAQRCSGVATVCVTRLFPHPHPKRVSSFTSRDDLISALLASCHIPRYFNGELTTQFRGRTAIDGGMTALIPAPAGHHDFVLKVSCFPRAHVARLPVFNRRHAMQHLSLGIAPDAFRTWPYSFKDMMAAALHPHTDDFIVQLREAGRSDALRWAQSAGLAPPELGLQIHLPPVPPPGAGVAKPATAAEATSAAAAQEAALAIADVAEAAPGPAVAAAAEAVRQVQQEVAAQAAREGKTAE